MILTEDSVAITEATRAGTPIHLESASPILAPIPEANPSIPLPIGSLRPIAPTYTPDPISPIASIQESIEETVQHITTPDLLPTLSHHRTMKPETIGAIVVGVVLGVAFFVLIAWVGWKRRSLRAKRRAEAERAGRKVEEGRMAEKEVGVERDVEAQAGAGLKVPSTAQGGKRSMEAWSDVRVI